MNAFSGSSVTLESRPIVCRAIDDADLPAVVELLGEGFPERQRTYWLRGLAHLRDRPAFADYPRYGYLIAVDDVIVGCILLIVAQPVGASGDMLRANVSSWYVRPAYRSLASLLASKVFRHKALTFVNISPAPHTLPILQAQGYRRYAGGQFVMRPTLRAERAKVTRWHGGSDTVGLSAEEADLLRRHSRYGCLALIAQDSDGTAPFVFTRGRPVRGFIPAMQLLWCRDDASLMRFAGPIGRYLLLRGWPALVIDANGPIGGLSGIYRRDRAPKFYRGPNPPRIGDLADTELAIFGV